MHGRCECGTRFAAVTKPAAKTQVALARIVEASLSGPVDLALSETEKVAMTTSDLVRLIFYLERDRYFSVKTGFVVKQNRNGQEVLSERYQS